MTWVKLNKTEIFVLSILCICVSIIQYIQNFGFQISFLDNDDYMRMIRLKEFFIHHDLNNSIINRGNYPYGVDLHWTRFYDFFLIIPSYLLSLFNNSLNKSIEQVCFYITPIIKLISALLIFRISLRFQKKLSAFLTSAIFCCTLFSFGYLSFGRPDHHAFIMLFLLIYVGSIIRNVVNIENTVINHIKTAIVATLCVWISPETLIVIIASQMILFIVYFNDTENLRNLYFQNILTSCFISFIIFMSNTNNFSSHIMTICLLLLLAPYALLKKYCFQDKILQYWHFVCLLLMMFMFYSIKPVEYDKISVVHVALFLCIATFFVINMQLVGRKSRISDAILWAVTIGVIFLSMYPLFLKGMEGNISNYVKHIWLNHVSEMQSPLIRSGKYIFIAYTIITTIAMITKFSDLIKKKITKINIVWWLLLGLSTIYLFLACFAYRMWPYSALFGLPIIVNVCMENQLTRHIHKLFRILICIFFTIIFVYPVAILCPCNNKDDINKLSNKMYKEISLAIDKLSDKPVVIMENCNLGTKILYYTKHCVLAVPYHRSTEGIISCHECLNKYYDEKRIKEILLQTKINYIIIHKHGKYKENTLCNMIQNGNYPNFLKLVKMPESCNNIIVMQVNL